MYAFDYHKPGSLEEAARLFGAADDPQFLAGGQTIIPVLKQRLAMPSDVIDLAGIPGLDAIEATPAAVTIGAMASHAAVASSRAVRESIPALATLAKGIGDPAVRNRGTIGGSIANNDPAADYPAALLALAATVHTATRAIVADAFFTGMFETSLEEGEIIARVEFPVPEKAAYVKFANEASRYALAGVFVAKRGDEVRVAVTGAGPCVFRVPAMEAALSRNFAPEALEDIEIDADGLNSDIHASASYRAHLVGVLARRAVAAAR
ncbi:MAG: xanthine dehydrogenase family protein subunit M [Methyloligellaceae bacterium]